MPFHSLKETKHKLYFPYCYPYCDAFMPIKLSGTARKVSIFGWQTFHILLHPEISLIHQLSQVKDRCSSFSKLQFVEGKQNVKLFPDTEIQT